MNRLTTARCPGGFAFFEGIDLSGQIVKNGELTLYWHSETKLKEMAKSMGGRWDPEVRLWYIHYGKIKGTELEKHVILDASMKSKISESI